MRIPTHHGLVTLTIVFGVALYTALCISLLSLYRSSVVISEVNAAESIGMPRTDRDPSAPVGGEPGDAVEHHSQRSPEEDDNPFRSGPFSR